MTAVSIPHPPPRLARAANGLPLTAAGGRWRVNAHGGGRRRGHSRDMAEGDGTATDSVWHHLTPDPHFGPKHAMQIRLDFGNRGAFPGHASNVHVPRERRNTDLTGIVLNSYALGAMSCVPSSDHVAGMPPGRTRRRARIGGLQFSTITAWRRAPGTAAVHSTPLGCRTQSYYRKARRRHPTAAPP